MIAMSTAPAMSRVSAMAFVTGVPIMTAVAVQRMIGMVHVIDVCRVALFSGSHSLILMILLSVHSFNLYP